MTVVAGLTSAAEARGVDGRADRRSGGLSPAGEQAPDLALLDHTGESRYLSKFWTGGPALLMFWRHFGCGCGVDIA